jgi:hypothetical protein
MCRQPRANESESCLPEPEVVQVQRGHPREVSSTQSVLQFVGKAGHPLLFEDAWDDDCFPVAEGNVMLFDVLDDPVPEPKSYTHTYTCRLCTLSYLKSLSITFIVTSNVYQLLTWGTRTQRTSETIQRYTVRLTIHRKWGTTVIIACRRTGWIWNQYGLINMNARYNNYVYFGLPSMYNNVSLLEKY